MTPGKKSLRVQKLTSEAPPKRWYPYDGCWRHLKVVLDSSSATLVCYLAKRTVFSFGRQVSLRNTINKKTDEGDKNTFHNLCLFLLTAVIYLPTAPPSLDPLFACLIFLSSLWPDSSCLIFLNGLLYESTKIHSHVSTC